MKLKALFPGFLALALIAAPHAARACQQTLTIAGLVKRPLTLTTDDLAKFQSTTVRINHITQKKSFHGVFSTQGVPLKNLLETALVEKEASGYNKPVDLAIVVRDKDGRKVTLSWGEVFYRNPSDVTIAYSATPVMPHNQNCGSCHSSGFTKPVMEQLSRQVCLPKLVMANDFHADRSLEGIVSIEVVDLHPKVKTKKKGELVSTRLVISGAGPTPFMITDLSTLPRTQVTVNVVGDGRGFHGRSTYEGVPLAELLTAVGAKPDLRSVVTVSAVDGYRSLVSWGELVLSPEGRNIIIADTENGQPLEKSGKFVLALPGDLAADRDVKAVDRIEVHTFNEPAKIYVIGMGPGDTDLMTRESVTYLGRSDLVVAPAKLYKDFSSLLAGKPLLFDSMSLIHKSFFAESHPEYRGRELDEKFVAERENAVKQLKEELKAGRSIAFLDWGDPMLYGSSRWIRKHFADYEIETVPALSAFNASNALLERDMTCRGSLVMSVPNALKANQALLKAAADNGDTLVIFSGLREFREMLPLFLTHYKGSTPVAIVYNAGISSAENVVRGTLDDILEKTKAEQEQFLGMIYVGPCLMEKSGECH